MGGRRTGNQWLTLGEKKKGKSEKELESISSERPSQRPEEEREELRDIIVSIVGQNFPWRIVHNHWMMGQVPCGFAHCLLIMGVVIILLKSL